MIEIDDELAQAFTLRGKVAVITGAGSGLGQETARIFALAGARLVLADIDEAGLAGTVGLLGGAEVVTRRVLLEVTTACSDLIRHAGDIGLDEKKTADLIRTVDKRAGDLRATE